MTNYSVTNFSLRGFNTITGVTQKKLKPNFFYLKLKACYYKYI